MTQTDPAVPTPAPSPKPRRKRTKPAAATRAPRVKRPYVVQESVPDPRTPGADMWTDTKAIVGDNEADALKAARAENLRGRIRIIRVCGVFELTERPEPRITVNRIE